MLPKSILILMLTILLVNIFPNVINSASGDALIGDLLKSSNSNSTSHTNKSLVDKSGIKEIYPTRSGGGREWYVNMSFPLNDKSFYLSGGGENTNSSAITNVTSSNSQLIKQADGSYQ